MTQDRFGYWPEGAAYRTPQPPPVSPPPCPACGSRHNGKTINCDLTNEFEEDPNDPTAE